MNRWFRWYEQTCEDGKFRVVARMSRVTVRDVIALWAFMLEDAANLEHRGICQRNEDFMASILDFEDGVVESILAAMEEANMISVGHGAITITNWQKRQFESDTDPTAADRQKRKRERDKSSVTHAPVTRDSRPPDTETDTDIRKGNFHPIKGRGNGRKGPRHGATGKGYTYVHQGTTEWEVYAADWRKIKFCEPEPDQNGGKWFKTVGEAGGKN